MNVQQVLSLGFVWVGLHRLRHALGPGTQGKGHSPGTYEHRVVRGLQSGREDPGLGEQGQDDQAVGRERPARNWPPSTGHKDEVYSVAFSPDGKTLASGSLDKTIKLWEVATGKERATFEGHSDGVTSVAFSPDGKTLASGSDDTTIKLWDVATGKEQATFKGHKDPVVSRGFQSGRQDLASGSEDKSSSSGTWQRARNGPRSRGIQNVVSSVAFSPDGKTLASGSRDNTIRLWDVKTGKEQAALDGTYG